MRILFVVDGRSPIALNWIEYFINTGYEVHLVSTFPSRAELNFASQCVIPVAFSALKSAGGAATAGARRGVWSASFLSFRTMIRQWLGLLTLPEAARKLAEHIQGLQPDLIHAMRIPFEGMLATSALRRLPKKFRPRFIVSVWGNDFTLHASSNPWMAALTRQTLQTANALHTDCQRDWRLAVKRGFSQNKPAVVLPGAGGIQSDIFYPPAEESQRQTPLVINPRGFRAYIRNDVFFKAIPRVLEQNPQARFLCPAMEGEAQAERWLDQLNIRSAVTLLPRLARPVMADLFRSAQVAVSPAIHDGTPNTLLEAMACGCFPVAGDLDSLREWIISGENGLLVDPKDPQALAEAILLALSDPVLRWGAMARNLRLIQQRAEYRMVMQQAEQFYQRIFSA